MTTKEDVTLDEKPSERKTERKIPVVDGLARVRELGRVGYEGYAASTGGKTFDGRDMPTWDALPDRIRQAWSDAATAIIIDAWAK